MQLDCQKDARSNVRTYAGYNMSEHTSVRMSQYLWNKLSENMLYHNMCELKLSDGSPQNTRDNMPAEKMSDKKSTCQGKSHGGDRTKQSCFEFPLTQVQARHQLSAISDPIVVQTLHRRIELIVHSLPPGMHGMLLTCLKCIPSKYQRSCFLLSKVRESQDSFWAFFSHLPYIPPLVSFPF
jgi:hypothetical protein